MSKIFIYSDNNSIAAELLGFAKSAGVIANVITFCETSAGELAKYGAEKIYLLKGGNGMDENYAKVVAELLKEQGCSLFLVGATPRGRDFGARAAGYLDCAMISDISKLEYKDGKISTERIVYGGAVVQSETVEGLAVVSVPGSKFESVSGGNAEIVTMNVEPDNLVTLEERAAVVSEGVDITTAEKVVGMGLGLNNKDDVALIETLAKALNAGIGGTRSIAEQRHWLPNYIGISGLMIKPSLYLAVAISGQVQHIVGVRDSKIIAAINIDEKAPIFNAADYGVVGDMHEIIDALMKEMK